MPAPARSACDGTRLEWVPDLTADLGEACPLTELREGPASPASKPEEVAPSGPRDDRADAAPRERSVLPLLDHRTLSNASVAEAPRAAQPDESPPTGPVCTRHPGDHPRAYDFNPPGTSSTTTSLGPGAVEPLHRNRVADGGSRRLSWVSTSKPRFRDGPLLARLSVGGERARQVRHLETRYTRCRSVDEAARKTEPDFRCA